MTDILSENFLITLTNTSQPLKISDDLSTTNNERFQFSTCNFQLFNDLSAEMHSLFRRTRKSEYKKILNTEHKFATLYVINSSQNIFIYYSIQYFTLKKLNLLGLIILPDPTDTGYQTDIQQIPDTERIYRYSPSCDGDRRTDYGVGFVCLM